MKIKEDATLGQFAVVYGGKTLNVAAVESRGTATTTYVVRTTLYVGLGVGLGLGVLLLVVTAVVLGAVIYFYRR